MSADSCAPLPLPLFPPLPSLSPCSRVDFYEGFLDDGNLPLRGPLNIWGVRVA
jgi:hypothetical protein